MGSFRFYRRVHIFPGLTVNVSKSGPSLSVGVRGAHVTVGRRGIRRTVGIPGTGIYYTSSTGYHTGVHSAHREGGVNHATVGWIVAAIAVGAVAMWLLAH
jgi:hypothetical protein